MVKIHDFSTVEGKRITSTVFKIILGLKIIPKCCIVSQARELIRIGTLKNERMKIILSKIGPTLILEND